MEGRVPSKVDNPLLYHGSSPHGRGTRRILCFYIYLVVWLVSLTRR